MPIEAPADPPLLIDRREVARLTSMSPMSVTRHAETGRLPMPLKIGRRRLWRRDELVFWIEAGCPRIER